MPNVKSLALTVAGGALVVLVGIAAYREFRAPGNPAPAAVTQPPAAPMGESHDRPPLSADEERYAHALWKIHADVRTQAVRMTFAGLSYKMGETPKEAVRERVAPLIPVFSKAASDVAAIPTPASMQPVGARYGEALALYTRASTEMVKVADDGKDEHLLRAQEMSEKASTILLEVSEKLWPGEYKPN